MFSELLPLLRKRSLLLTLSALDFDRIRVTVMPKKTGDDENDAVSTPLVVTGTAEELDRDMANMLVSYTGAHLSLQSTLTSAKAEMEAAAKTAREEARKKNGKTTARATTPAATEKTPGTEEGAPVRPPEAKKPGTPSLFAPAESDEQTDSEGDGEDENGESSTVAAACEAGPF